MKKFKKNISVTLCFVMIISSLTITAFAKNIDKIPMSDEQIVVLAEKYDNIDFTNSTVFKMSPAKKTEILKNINNIDFEKSNVYEVNSLKENGLIEKSIVTDIALKSLPSGNKVIEEGSGSHVVANCVIGYSRKTHNTVPYIKGEYFGGRIVSQPNSSAITSLKGVYHEYGACITSNGSPSYVTGKTINATFNIGNHTNWQTKNVNSSYYYNSEAGAAIQAKYIVSGKLNNSYNFSFTVYANAI